MRFNNEYMVMEAVDRRTGEFLTNLFQVNQDTYSGIQSSDYAASSLGMMGYDPYEHGHSFNDKGAIVLKFN